MHYLDLSLLVLLVINIFFSTYGNKIEVFSNTAFAIDSNFSTAATTEANLTNFNLAAAGDWDCNSNTEDTVSKVLNKNPKLILGLGDYSYAKTASCWIDIIAPIAHKMKIALGNHDVTSFSKLEAYKNYFNLTRPYYSFNYRNVHFIVLATEFSFDRDSEQYRFARNDLAKAALDPNIKWIMAYYHRLAYTSSTSAHPPIASFANVYHPLFQKYGVDLVLQGHNHFYERTYPIQYNISNSTNPIVSDNNKSSYMDPRGQIFATVGTAGAPSHKNPHNKSFYIVAQYSGYGFLNVALIDKGRTLNATFYANDGTIRDHFTITKENNSTLR